MEEKNKELKVWIETLINEKVGEGDVLDNLKDGVVLCKLANALLPNSCKYHVSMMKFKQMENVSNFIVAARNFGVPDTELFQTVDLVELKNPKQVIICLYSLSRNAQKMGFEGPTIGPRLSEKQNIEFSQDVIDKGKIAFHKQMGHYVDLSEYTKNIGVRRQITGFFNDGVSDKEDKGNGNK
jgi:hypothetical protein